MKKRIFNVLSMLSLFVSLSTLSGHAQSDPRILVTIPFDFKAGSTVLSAGDYVVQQGPVSQSTVLIRSVDYTKAAIVLTTPISTSSWVGQPRLEFNQYGDMYFLSKVWTAGSHDGLQLYKSRHEVEMAQINKQRQTASLTGHQE